MNLIDKRIQCQLPDPPAKEECPICMEKIDKKGIVITECNHKFCLTCILVNYDHSIKCPMCRSLIIDKNKLIKKTQIASTLSRTTNSNPQTSNSTYHQLIENALIHASAMAPPPSLRYL